jgi:hypothetical protein
VDADAVGEDLLEAPALLRPRVEGRARPLAHLGGDEPVDRLGAGRDLGRGAEERARAEPDLRERRVIAEAAEELVGLAGEPLRARQLLHERLDLGLAHLRARPLLDDLRGLLLRHVPRLLQPRPACRATAPRKAALVRQPRWKSARWNFSFGECAPSSGSP